MPYFSSNDPMIINHRKLIEFSSGGHKFLWDKVRYYLDYITCEIMFINDVTSPLDDLMILYASEVELLFLSYFLIFFGLILQNS